MYPAANVALVSLELGTAMSFYAIRAMDRAISMFVAQSVRARRSSRVARRVAPIRDDRASGMYTKEILHTSTGLRHGCDQERKLRF